MLVSSPYTQGVRVVGVGDKKSYLSKVTATQKIPHRRVHLKELLIHQNVRIFLLLIHPHRSHTLTPVLTRA